MRSFWVWLTLLVMSWLGAMLPELQHGNAGEMPWRIGGSAIFFAAFFVAPIYKSRPVKVFIALSIAAVFAIVALWPTSSSGFNLYSILVYSIVAGKAAYRLPPVYAAIIGLVLLSGALMPGMLGYSDFPILFYLLYAVILTVGLSVFCIIRSRYEEMSLRSETLLSEYRKMKRRLIADEQHARQEERAQVGRDIHDSVGHKLTALLMQLEMRRMQADGETADMLTGLKTLAKESLEETRAAVKSLKHQEAGGLPAIMGLLRRLESESFMRVNLTARHGALTAPLNNAQSIAVYRAVQEAITNAMKHGSSKEVHVLFEAPGGGLFRFEVSNACSRAGQALREGYGLQSMRERIEGAGGQLELFPYDNQFVIRGTFLTQTSFGKEEIH